MAQIMKPEIGNISLRNGGPERTADAFYRVGLYTVIRVSWQDCVSEQVAARSF